MTDIVSNTNYIEVGQAIKIIHVSSIYEDWHVRVDTKKDVDLWHEKVVVDGFFAVGSRGDVYERIYFEWTLVSIQTP
jgi:hypothetical protein